MNRTRIILLTILALLLLVALLRPVFFPSPDVKDILTNELKEFSSETDVSDDSMSKCLKNNVSDVLTKEYLTQNEWGPDIGNLGLFFEFKEDNTFKTDANCETGDGFSGTYEITDNKLVLKIVKESGGSELIGKKITLNLVSEDKAIFFTQYLTENSKDPVAGKLWNNCAFVKNGQERTFQGVKAVTINDMATIKDSTSYYQFPRESSKRFMFSIADYENDYKASNWSYTVPVKRLNEPYINIQVQLILKTAEKDNNNIYWYCILLPVQQGRYDGVKLEGSSEDHRLGADIGWIKETDIEKITPRE